MNRFASLLQPDAHSTVGDEQCAAAHGFPAAVRASGFQLAAVEAPSTASARLLIGVAPYSLSDLRLLDLLEAAMSSDDFPAMRVEVFNVLDCCGMADFERLIPGIGMVWQTPVVAWWEEGFLRDKGQGKEGRELLLRRCGLSATVLDLLWEPAFVGR